MRSELLSPILPVLGPPSSARLLHFLALWSLEFLAAPPCAIAVLCEHNNLISASTRVGPCARVGVCVCTNTSYSTFFVSMISSCQNTFSPVSAGRMPMVQLAEPLPISGNNTTSQPIRRLFLYSSLHFTNHITTTTPLPIMPIPV